jgi:hypothetical protein
MATVVKASRFTMLHGVRDIVPNQLTVMFALSGWKSRDLACKYQPGPAIFPFQWTDYVDRWFCVCIDDKFWLTDIVTDLDDTCLFFQHQLSQLYSETFVISPCLNPKLWTQDGIT